MHRQSVATLHRQRDINSQDWMIDQGTAEAMVMRVMDQPRAMRSQYTIVQVGLVYQPDQILIFAQELGLANIVAPPLADDGADIFA